MLHPYYNYRTYGSSLHSHNPGSPGVIHRRSEKSFSMRVAYDYHDTSCDVGRVDKVQPKAKFKVEVKVSCKDPGCDLRGRKIQVFDHEGKLAGEGTLTERHTLILITWHIGWVEVTAPERENFYTWKAVFPQQGP